MIFAVIEHISKEKLLVGKLQMVLEVVEGMLKNTVINAILVFVSFI